MNFSIFLTLFLVILGLANSTEIKNEKLNSLMKEASENGLSEDLKERIKAEMRQIVEPIVIDPFINTILRILNLPDPIELPGPIEIPIGINNLTISDLSLDGISTLHRVGDVDIEFAGLLMVVKAHLGLNDLKIRLRAQLEFLGLPIDAILNLGLGWIDIIATFRMRIALQPPFSATIDDVMMENTGPLDFEIVGLGPILDLAANPIVNFLGGLIKELLVRILSPLFVTILNQFLEGIGIIPVLLENSFLKYDGEIEEYLMDYLTQENPFIMKHNFY